MLHVLTGESSLLAMGMLVTMMKMLGAQAAMTGTMDHMVGEEVGIGARMVTKREDISEMPSAPCGFGELCACAACCRQVPFNLLSSVCSSVHMASAQQSPVCSTHTKTCVLRSAMFILAC